jgi:hypothetical protein
MFLKQKNHVAHYAISFPLLSHPVSENLIIYQHPQNMFQFVGRDNTLCTHKKQQITVIFFVNRSRVFTA